MSKIPFVFFLCVLSSKLWLWDCFVGEMKKRLEAVFSQSLYILFVVLFEVLVFGSLDWKETDSTLELLLLSILFVFSLFLYLLLESHYESFVILTFIEKVGWKIIEADSKLIRECKLTVEADSLHELQWKGVCFKGFSWFSSSLWQEYSAFSVSFIWKERSEAKERKNLSRNVAMPFSLLNRDSRNIREDNERTRHYTLAVCSSLWSPFESSFIRGFWVLLQTRRPFPAFLCFVLFFDSCSLWRESTTVVSFNVLPVLLYFPFDVMQTHSRKATQRPQKLLTLDLALGGYDDRGNRLSERIQERDDHQENREECSWEGSREGSTGIRKDEEVTQ